MRSWVFQKIEMLDLFADTSGWGHLVDPAQAHHSLAADLYREARQQGRKLVTTNCSFTQITKARNFL